MSMEYSPSWEANKYSLIQSRNPPIFMEYCLAYNSATLVPIGTNEFSRHTSSRPISFKIYFHNILPSTSRPSKWTLPFWFPE
jgi:hypothetical protein